MFILLRRNAWRKSVTGAEQECFVLFWIYFESNILQNSSFTVIFLSNSEGKMTMKLPKKNELIISILLWTLIHVCINTGWPGNASDFVDTECSPEHMQEEVKDLDWKKEMFNILFAICVTWSSSCRTISTDFQTLSRHSSLTSIASGRYSGLHLVSKQNCCM